MLIHLTRRKWLTRLSYILVILVSLFYLINRQTWIKELSIFHRSVKTSWLHRGNCNPAKNVAYLKTHKCFSSSYQNILFRYGLSHNLIFALPEGGSNYFGRFIPFHSSMVPQKLRDAFPLNILALHTIWNHSEVKSVMPADTVYFTSIREPTSLFESLYSYAMDKSQKTLDEYVKTTEITDKRVNGHIGYNQMNFDFGIEMSKIQNLTYVKEKILEADKNFDLVLVAERLEESLVLLKHLLCWSLEDVIAIKLNARQEKFKSVMKEDIRKLLDIRQIPDRLLYEHFSKKFDKLVKEFGEKKMEREVEVLRAATKKKIKDCGFRQQDFKKLRGRHKVYSNKVRGYTSESKSPDCLNIASSELFLIDQILKKQRLKINRKTGNNKSSSYILENLPMGAIALDDKKSLNEKSEILKKYMFHS